MRSNVFTYAMLATTCAAVSAMAQGAGTPPDAPAAGATAPPAAPAAAQVGAEQGGDAQAGTPAAGAGAAATPQAPEAAPGDQPGAPATAVAGAEAGTAGASLEAAAPVPLVAPPPPAAPAPEKSYPSFKFYGHARLDMTYATQRMAHHQFGLWAQSPTATGGAEAEDKPELSIYPRWSRLGVDALVAEPDEDVKITAKVEIDFHGGGSESRELPRMRHAYGQVAFGDLAILGGQTWDLFAPLIYGGMEQAIFWYGGNLGDRRPQLRATLSPRFGNAQLVLAGALAQSGALDMADVDGDSVVDGIAAARPAMQGLAELKLKLGAKDDAKPLRVGVSFHSGAKTILVDGVDEELKVLAGVAHLEVPVSIITLSAEGFLGENLSDLRGGVGQGIETTTAVDADGATYIVDAKTIPAKGGFIQLQVDPIAWYSLQLGAGVDNPKGVNPGGRGLNQTVHFGNAFKPYEHLIIGAVYDYYHTDYVGEDWEDANSHRLTAYTMVPF